MNILDLSVFLAIAEEGSFSAGADRCGVSASGATRRIAALEARLGTRLLMRSTRSVKLTAAGDIFLKWAREMLHRLDETKDSIEALQQNPAGVVRIACPEFLAHRYLIPFNGELAQSYPAIKLAISTTDSSVDLQAEHFDLAVHSGRQPEGFLFGRKLWEVDIAVCASPSYLSRFGTPRHPNELLEHRCLSHSVYDRQYWEFSIEDSILRQEVNIASMSNNTMLLRNMALEGQGMIRTTRRLVRPDLTERRLVEVLNEFQPKPAEGTPLETWLIYPDRMMLYRTRIVLDLLTEFLLHARNKEALT
tara:strand:- start:6061 stop:6975 length:915 start_codon:yes stop_codon:yes gene_type:complete